MDTQQQSQEQLTGRRILWAGAAVVLLTIAVLIGYRYGITLWDWIKLLIVPVAIAGGGLWFNRQQHERELATASQQRKRELEIARQQREQELKIAERRTQDEALQAYLDQMSDMLIPNKDQPSLYDEHAPDSLRTVARARTLTVLPRLAGDGKARVVQFLYEAGLITRGRPIVDLALADLKALSGGNLRKAYLSDPIMKEVYKAAELIDANLSSADLSGANLSGAELSRTNLSEANLRDADLSKADLSYANLSEANLSTAVLRDAELSRTNLVNANLSGADLSKAVLRDAELSGVDLSYANLSEANLYEGDMGVPPERIWTTRLTNEQLEQRAKSVKGAIMPDPQRYEDWLEDREDRKENAENGGTS